MKRLTFRVTLAAIPTTWPYQSMVFAARTADGVFVVDLGWGGADRALRRGLRRNSAGAETRIRCGVGADGPAACADVEDSLFNRTHRHFL